MKIYMQNKIVENKIVIFESKKGSDYLNYDKNKQTIWATQVEMARIFAVNTQAITKHIQNIYNQKELIKDSTSSILEQVRLEGNRSVHRKIEIYNLDVIISVGYRINSLAGTAFRQWANSILTKYIISGYAINKKLIENNYSLFNKAIEDIKLLVNKDKNLEIVGIIEIIKSFANTWLSLDAYDKNILPSKGTSIKSIDISSAELVQSIQTLKQELINTGTASELFAIEREDDSINSIVRNVYQSISNQEVYPSIEEKAANLLYLIIKNHPFIACRRLGFIMNYCKLLN